MRAGAGAAGPRGAVAPDDVPRHVPQRRVRLGWLTPYLFLLPAVGFLLTLLLLPILFNVQLSFRDVTAATMLSGDTAWVGLDHYRELLANRAFRRTVINTLIFTGASLTFQVAIGLALALFYNRGFPGARWMRALYLVSWTIPIITSGAVFRWLLDGQYGVVNYLLSSLGVISRNVQWLANPDVALISVTIANIWLGIPFNLMLLLAGLQGIPSDVYEAAAIDGAGPWSRFRFVTLPLLRPALLAVLMLGLIFTFKVFDIVWVMTRGGPLGFSEVASTLAYRMVFEQFRFGPGAAVLNLMLVALFLLSLVYLWMSRAEGKE